MRLRLLSVVVCLLVSGCAVPDEAMPPEDETPPANGAPGDDDGVTDDDPSAPIGDPSLADVALEQLVGGLDHPVHLTHDWLGRLFIVEQAGRVLVWEDGGLRDEIFVDVSDRVRSGGEQGLLSVAFDPQEPGVAYLSYTDVQGDSVLARYRLDGDVLDAESEQVMLRVEQPFANHNGGLALFGPDGHLYFSLGDGGSGGDPEQNGQDSRTLLGAILRLDVRGHETYEVPQDNPFANGEAGAPEVWAYGLRNPWRFAFDAATGDLFIADVGQNRVEEINFQPAKSRGGENYGWNVWEGSLPFRDDAERDDLVFPVHEYRIDDGPECAIVGGVVYRGSAIPDLLGAYLFGDFCSGRVWALWQETDKWQVRTLFETDLRISSFGEDASGEVFVIDRGGSVHRLVAASSASSSA